MGNRFSWADMADKKNKWLAPFLICSGLILYWATALTNIGIIALDDYAFGIAKIIPAQKITFTEIIGERGIRLPFQTLILAYLSKFALSLGITDPSSQLKFVLLVVGTIVYLMHAYYGTKLLEFSKNSAKNTKFLFLFFLGFYFVAPLLFTRPLIENLAGPFLTASAYYAVEFWNKRTTRSLFFGLFTVMIASLFRYQTGVCMFAVLFACLLRGKVRDQIVFLASAAFCFFLSGAIDWYITGTFHGSFLSYVSYNAQFSSTFGVQPFYLFTLLFIALTVPPTFISKYEGFEWKKEYGPILPAIVSFLVFLIIHSAVPHKEERFMVPVLALFLLLLTPLASHLVFVQKKKWRVAYFCAINFLILPFASFNVPQKNTIGLVEYLNTRPDIRTIFTVQDSLTIFPTAYSLNPATAKEVSTEEAGKLKLQNCSEAVAVRKDYEPRLASLGENFVKLDEFQPGILEALLVKLNPKHNIRRGAVSLYQDKTCLRNP